MQKQRTTIRGMMVLVAAVAAVFGALMNFAWLVPLILLMSPQLIIIAACAYMAVREGKSQGALHPPRPVDRPK